VQKCLKKSFDVVPLSKDLKDAIFLALGKAYGILYFWLKIRILKR
jgi:hypothetical protein